MINRLIDKVGRKLLGNSLWLFIDKIVRLLVGLFIGVLVARYLGPERMGVWSYCIAIFTFFIIFPTLGLEYVTPREFITHKGKAEQLLNTTIVLKFIGATVGIVLSVLFIGIYKGFDSPLVPFILILTTGYLFQSFDAIDYYYQSRLEQKKSVFARMIAFLIVSMYKFYLVHTEAPLIWFIASSTIDFAMGAVGLYISFRGSALKLKLSKVDFKLARDLLKDSVVFSISAFVIIIYYKIDQVMITEILGERENGIYSVSIRIYELFIFIPAVLISSFLPVITEKFKSDEIEFRASMKQLYSILTYLAIAFSICVWFTAPLVMDLLYGEAYQGSGEVLQLIGLGFYSVLLGMGTGNYLIITNRKRFVLIKSLIGLSLNVVINLWLIPILGLNGAVLASIISNFVSTFLILVLKDNHNHLSLILSPFNIASIKRFLKY
ncbi:MAG: PST family polysaccharide transporter [Vicingaceae bacterium]|jgi:PST family polysaccharide transporter